MGKKNPIQIKLPSQYFGYLETVVILASQEFFSLVLAYLPRLKTTSAKQKQDLSEMDKVNYSNKLLKDY